MYQVQFDLENRSFSVVETKEFGVKGIASKVGGHLAKHSTKYVTGVGAAAGGVTAGMKAKRRAKELDLTPGSSEYKKFVAKKTAVGAGVGAGVGLATGMTGKRAVDVYKGGKIAKALGVKHPYAAVAKGRAQDDINAVKSTAGKAKGSIVNKIKSLRKKK